MNLEEAVIPLSYLQSAFLLASLAYDARGRRFHLGKWGGLFAIPQACISISLLWTAAAETVRTTNLISVMRNASVWMEALLSIIYGVHNTYAEWRLGGRVLRDLLSFNDEWRRRRRHAFRIMGANGGAGSSSSSTTTAKVKRLTRRAIAVCFVANAIGVLQWLFVAETATDGIKHLLIELPNMTDNILITKWCIYMNIITEYNQRLLYELKRCRNDWDGKQWQDIRRDYSQLHFIYREIVECFAIILVVFVVCQYVRLLWHLYMLTECFILNKPVEFHTVYEVVVQIFSLFFVVLPCLWIRQAAGDIGRACSRIYGGSVEVQTEVLNFQFQILVQDYNVRPYGAMELNATLITSVFSTMLVYLVLLIQMARL